MKNIIKNKKRFFLDLIKSLITPAYGCSEIGAVALAASVAGEHLTSAPKSIKVWVSSYIYRNDVNVGVPNMGKVGIKAIVAAGYVAKNSKQRLSVLSKITNKQIEMAKSLVAKNIVDVEISKGCNPVYVKVLATDKNNDVCEVLIEEEHDNIKQVKLNNKILISKQNIISKVNYKFNVNEISLPDIFQCIKQMNEKELRFLLKGVEMNKAVAQYGSKHNELKTKYSRLSNEAHTQHEILTTVVEAVNARMLGCPLPVMASCDSGDHGLTVNLPQYIYHTEENTSTLILLQAIAFANIITWKIKKSIGSLSAYCGSVIAAATATLCGLGFQKGYTIKQINDLINFCLCSFIGSLCDGAKLSCSWKIESALLIGFRAMNLVENEIALENNEGFVNKDAFETIKLLGNLSRFTTEITNNEIVDVIQKNSIQ